MFDPPPRPAIVADPALASALERAAAAVARLDQALAGHPLRPALLHRAHLEAVRRQAAVDRWAVWRCRFGRTGVLSRLLW